MRFRYVLFMSLLLLSLSIAQNRSNCESDTIYSTNDYLYKDTYFKDYARVDSFPRFQGGKDSIQQYFQQSIQFEGDETELFARYHIIFLVNCQGALSHCELKSKPFPGYKKILDACTKMSPWIPAKKNGIAVNCFYRLGFTNRAGKIVVDYREN